MDLSLGHLYELISPYNSFYVYVCFDWNDAFDNWDKLDRVTFDILS